MGLDDLLKGLAVFNQGMKDFAISKGVNDANEKLQKLNSQEMDRGQRLQAQTQIGNELAMRLGAAGADPGQIAATAGQIAPSAGAQFQAEESSKLQSKSQSFEAQQNDLDRANRLAIAKLSQEKASSKLGMARQKELGGFITKYQESFNKLAGKDIEAYNSAYQAEEVLKSGNPIGDNAVKMMLARAVQGSSQLSDAEREVFGGSPGAKDKVAQIASEYATGKMSPQNRQYMMRLVNQLRVVAEKKVKSKRDQVAAQAHQRASKTGYDFDLDEIRTTIAPEDSLLTVDSKSQTGAPKAPASPQAPVGSSVLNKYIK